MSETVRLHFTIDDHQHDIGVQIPNNSDGATLELRARVLEAAEGIVATAPGELTRVWLADENGNVITESKTFNKLTWE